jgi:hypothetical protein
MALLSASILAQLPRGAIGGGCDRNDRRSACAPFSAEPHAVKVYFVALFLKVVTLYTAPLLS